MSSLAVACPKAPCIRFVQNESHATKLLKVFLILESLIRRLVIVRRHLEWTDANLSLTLW